jgi:ketosteroid isomerase-like protein
MDIIDNFCKCFVENNSDKFSALFTENAIYMDCLYGKFSGKSEIMRFYLRCHKEASDYDFVPKNKMLHDNGAAFEWDFSFVSEMPFSKGKEIKISGCSFISMENSKISFYRDYCDSILFLLQGNVPDFKIMEFYKKKYNEL